MDRKRNVGLTEHIEGKASAGYTVFSSFGERKTRMVDLDGRLVHSWDLPETAGLWAQLLESGNLLVAISTGKSTLGGAGGGGGAVLELDWDGNEVWRYDDDEQHHDFSRCPNGNTMILGRELVPSELTGAVQGGFPGSEPSQGILGDYFHEVTPAGEVVWEWHTHEGLDFAEDVICPLHDRREWTHANACTVLPDGNVLTSFRLLNTIGIVDRTTGTFSWKHRDMALGHQHDPTLLENGNILGFANGWHVPGPSGSVLFEIDPRTDETVWEYRTKPPWEFSSYFISGAQRLPNGNTLICEGMTGRLFEVTMDSEVVWEYVNPFFGEHPRHGYVNSLFRARRYAPDFRGLAGRTLTAEA